LNRFYENALKPGGEILFNNYGSTKRVLQDLQSIERYQIRRTSIVIVFCGTSHRLFQIKKMMLIGIIKLSTSRLIDLVLKRFFQLMASISTGMACQTACILIICSLAGNLHPGMFSEATFTLISNALNFYSIIAVILVFSESSLSFMRIAQQV